MATKVAWWKGRCSSANALRPKTGSPIKGNEDSKETGRAAGYVQSPVGPGSAAAGGRHGNSREVGVDGEEDNGQGSGGSWMGEELGASGEGSRVDAVGAAVQL